MSTWRAVLITTCLLTICLSIHGFLLLFQLLPDYYKIKPGQQYWYPTELTLRFVEYAHKSIRKQLKIDDYPLFALMPNNDHRPGDLDNPYWEQSHGGIRVSKSNHTSETDMMTLSPTTLKKISQRRYLVGFLNGSIGDQLFTYSTIYGLARASNREPVFCDDQSTQSKALPSIYNYFPLLVPKSSTIKCNEITSSRIAINLTSSTCCWFKARIVAAAKISSFSTLALRGKFNSYRYWYNRSDSVTRKSFSMKSTVIQRAQKIVNDALITSSDQKSHDSRTPSLSERHSIITIVTNPNILHASSISDSRNSFTAFITKAVLSFARNISNGTAVTESLKFIILKWNQDSEAPSHSPKHTDNITGIGTSTSIQRDGSSVVEPNSANSINLNTSIPSVHPPNFLTLKTSFNSSTAGYRKAIKTRRSTITNLSTAEHNYVSLKNIISSIAKNIQVKIIDLSTLVSNSHFKDSTELASAILTISDGATLLSLDANSWWLGYLCPGRVVYNKLQVDVYKKEKKIGRKITKLEYDYVLPSWVGI